MNRRSVAVGVLVLLAAGAISGAAMGAIGSDPQPEPVTASQYYSDDMSLEEISAASQGKPGDVAPPCPQAPVVQDLKTAGLPVGPCDPVPEAGRPVILPDQAAEQAASAQENQDARICPAIFIRSTDGASARVQAPCGTGAQIVDAESFKDSSGRTCAKVTYLPAVAAAAKKATACEGDPVSASGTGIIISTTKGK